MTISNTPFTPSAQNAGINYYSEVVGVNTACTTPLERWTYYNSLGAAFAREQDNYEYDIGSENCGEGTLGQINTNIQKFFIFLKGIKKYEQLYIQGTINKVANLQSNIKKTARAIAGIIRVIIQRTRNWIIGEIKDMVTNVLENFLTPLMKRIKKATFEQVIDQIFCAFDRIIDSLIDLVGDFLFSLIGQVVNAPFCVAERWANALINRVVSDIDKALAPLFNQINDLLGGIAKVTGSVMKAVNFILGFEGFFCKTPDCPALTKFAASPWGGPTKDMTKNFNEFEFLPATTSTDITKSTTEWMDTVGLGTGTASASPGECYNGTFECGIPQIVLFGGGGSGAVAQAVINNIGQVIGSNVLNGGTGYTAPPFVSIQDPAGCGNNASGAAVINNEGEVIDVIITNPGTGYDDTYNGGAPIISSFVGSPNPMVLGNSVTLSWTVSNADWVGLSEPAGLSGLPLNGNASVIITEDDVIVPPGATTSSKKFTLTAKKTHLNSEEQVTTRDFIVSTLAQGVPDPSVPNTLPPQIDSFVVEPTLVQRGGLVTLTWQTENLTSLSLSGSYIWNNATYQTEEGNFPTLPEDGSISFVIPTHNNQGGVQFPTGSDQSVRSYTLTAINMNAPVNNTGAVNTISQTVNVTVERIAGSLGPGIGTGGIGIGGTSAGTGVGTTITVGLGTITATGAGTTITTGTGTGGTGIGGTSPVTTTSPPGSTSGTGNNNAVAVISNISIINTGIGYTSGATATVVGGGGGSPSNAAINATNGAAVDIVTNTLGQIVDIKLLSGGYGFTKIPQIKINSKTGVGADFRTNLKFIPLEQFLEDQNLEALDPNKLVQVVDCVTS